MAQHFALNKYQLIRHFKQQVGVTPSVYLTRLRVELAKNLLAQGHLLVEVALESGFYEQSHFTRHFRTYTGITPDNYQRNCLTFQE
jgi:AraC-like DNA-binding protein